MTENIRLSVVSFYTNLVAPGLEANINNVDENDLFADENNLLDEVTSYLSDVNTTMDGLSYWYNARKQMPILAEIALRQLLALSSSAPAERVFSLARCIESRQRYAILENTMEDYILISSGYDSGLVSFK